MTVGIHGANLSADRLSSLKYEVQTPLLFGRFIHDFFWVNRTIKINAHLHEPNRGGDAICLSYFSDMISAVDLENERSAVADVIGIVTNS